MAKKDLYSSLQKIASESVGSVSTNDTGNKDIIDKQDMSRIQETMKLANQMYPNDADKRFQYWKRNTSLDGSSAKVKNFYWKQYEKMHPNGLDGAKADLINTTLTELSYINGVSNKEFFLRDRIAYAPEWARASLEPELAKLSTSVATANLSKATQVYSKSLQEKLNKFVVNNDLDADVSIEQHTNDFVKLEQLNLFDVASVVNGRVGVYGQNGEFIPGFAVEDRKQVFPKDPYGMPSVAEQLMIKDSAVKPIKEAIEGKVYTQRSGIAQQERQSIFETTKKLENGDFTIDKWTEAFSIGADITPSQLIATGLKGEIKAGRVKSATELTEAIYSAMVKYPSMFGDLNGTTG